MAVTTPAAPAPTRPVPLRRFATLKLRMLRNSLRGNPARVLSFLGGALLGFMLAWTGFFLLAVSSAGGAQARLLTASFAGAGLVVGSVLLPLIWFGIDDTLDPARFALLPLPRWRLLLGLFTAALVSVPAVAVLAATTGLLVPAMVHGGVGALAGQAVGLLCGLLLCVAASRAVTSAFATMLRSRRVRDLAGILLASLAALVAPLQIFAVSAAGQADWRQLATLAEVIGWTPLAAPYTIGFELAEGRPGAAAAKLLIGVAAVAALLWWWSRSLESALVGAVSSGPTRTARPGRAGAVGPLFPRLLPGLPANAFGAIVAREVRYWWRDAKRRANLITIAVMGVLVPLILSGGSQFSAGGGEAEFTLSASPSQTAHYLTMLLVAGFTAVLLANQFGFDGTAYAGQLTAAVPGRLELRARAAAHAILLGPFLLALGVGLGLLRGEPVAVLGTWGVLLAGYGTGLAVSSYLSVGAAYALPEGSNPFATASGSGLSKSFLALVAIVVAGLAAAPVLVAAALLGEAWPWLAVPLGGGYGLAAAALGCRFAGDLLDRRGPELLAAITPRA